MEICSRAAIRAWYTSLLSWNSREWAVDEVYGHVSWAVPVIWQPVPQGPIDKQFVASDANTV